MLLQISKSPRFDKNLRSKVWPEMMMDEDNHEPAFPLHLISRSMLLDTISQNNDIKSFKKKPTVDVSYKLFITSENDSALSELRCCLVNAKISFVNAS